MLGVEGDDMELTEEEQMQFIQKAARKSTLINLFLFVGIVAALRIGKAFVHICAYICTYTCPYVVLAMCVYNL